MVGHELEAESSVIAIIQDINRRPVRELSSTEEQIFSIAEAKVNKSVGKMAVPLVETATEAEEAIRAIALKYPDVVQKLLSNELERMGKTS